MPSPNAKKVLSQTIIRCSGALVTSLKAVVSDILTSREFQMTERDGFLLAKKGEVEVIICLIGAGEGKALPAFLDHFRAFTGRKLVVSLVPLPESRREVGPRPDNLGQGRGGARRDRTDAHRTSGR